MKVKILVPVLVALAVGVGAGTALAQEISKAPAKGVKTRAAVTSLGGFSATVNAPIFLTGATVEIEPGGQTGRQQFKVPTYIYVIEGILVTEYEGGPIGVQGTQYHAAGQSFMDPATFPGWHNLANRSDKPVKYLMLHVGYPGRPDPIAKPEAE